MAKSKNVRTKKNIATAFKIIIWLLIIALLVGAFFAIRSLSNNFKDDIKTFYVVLDNKTITSDVGNLSLLDKEIQVHNLTGGGFTYEIVSNKSRTFDFEVSGTKYSFADKEVYTSAFDIKATDNALVIADTDMETIIHKMYGDGEINFLSPWYDDLCYFTLIIRSSADSATQIKLSFFTPIHVVDIELDKTQIVF